MQNSHNSPTVHTLLGLGAEFEGKLFFEGAVRIDGKFRGEVTSLDTLIIGESADVQGTLNVGNLILEGEFRGEVEAMHSIVLEQRARLYGSVTTARLEIVSGAIFEGNSRMQEAAARTLAQPQAETYERAPMIKEASMLEE